MKIFDLVLLIACGSLGCQQTLPSATDLDERPESPEETTGEPPVFPMELETVRASSSLLRDPRSLCELYSDAAVVGQFEVERIVADQGPDPLGERSGDIPVTAVTLQPRAVWKGANDKVLVRSRGGVRPDGVEMTTDASFSAGELVVVFLEKKWNDATWGAWAENVFHEADGGYTNGTVLGMQKATAADIAARLSAEPCEDVAPDNQLADEARTPTEEEPPHEGPDGVLTED